MNEKLSWLLDCHYNLFHSDLINRALHDDRVCFADFIKGCVDIHLAELDDDGDEYVPKEFKNI